MKGYEDLEKHRSRLMAMKNVVAVGIGWKVQGGKTLPKTHPAIVVSVTEKLPLGLLKKKDIVPTRVGELQTDVIETGVIRALVSRVKRHRPAPGGVSIGHEKITAGTLGCLVKRDGNTLILSNNHVLANSNEGAIGDAILQPGKYDGGTLASRIATLEDFVPIDFGGLPSECPIGKNVAGLLNTGARVAKRSTRLNPVDTQQRENFVDAAVAKPIDISLVSPEILDIGVYDGLERNVFIGREIQKSGRTTELTKDEVLQVAVSVKVQYGEGKIAEFEDQIMAGPMSAGGDSGSAVLDMDKKLIGLLFAGSDTTTIINRIGHVFDFLNLEEHG